MTRGLPDLGRAGLRLDLDELNPGAATVTLHRPERRIAGDHPASTERTDRHHGPRGLEQRPD